MDNVIKRLPRCFPDWGIYPKGCRMRGTRNPHSYKECDENHEKVLKISCVSQDRRVNCPYGHQARITEGMTMRAKAKIEVAARPEMKEAELCVLMALNMFDAAFPGQIRVRAVSATAMEVGVPDTPENAEAYGFAYSQVQCYLMNAGAPYTSGFDMSEPDSESDPGWITAFICAM